jgi:hypothetical protein
VKLRDIAFDWLRNGYRTVIKPLFVYSFNIVMLPLNINPLKLTMTAQKLRKPFLMVSLLITPDCDTIKPIKDVTASKDSIWPIRTPNKSIAFKMVVRLLFISVIGVTILAGLEVGSEVGSEFGSGIGSGMVLLSI